MASTIRKNIRVGLRTDEIIRKYAEENRCTYTAAFEKIVYSYDDNNRVEISKVLAEEIAVKLNELITKPLTRIRLGTNNADKNSQVIIELLNGIYNFEEIPTLVSTKDNEHHAVRKANDVVKERIEAFRIRSLERNKNNG